MSNQHLKLGKSLPKTSDKDLKLAKYLDHTVLPIPPTTLQNNADITSWGMLGNDQWGDCTCAAGSHAIMAWTDANKDLVSPSETQTLEAYTAVTAEECSCAGFNPSTGANDNGCACTDVLNYFKKPGIAGVKIDAWTTVQIHNQQELKQAIYLFGLIYIGIQMPISAQTQAHRWTVTNAALTGNSAPGSWGGHCVIVVGYNADGLDIISWGQRYRMTWGFWKAYVDEAYAILSPDYLTSNKAPNGLNLSQLQADLNLV